ncbi:uncharacterized protein TRIADDRAFT_54648 [Trichoplax adhaerens]|uniref:EamA domain-containing protein n=2 Tax=Trichoplax adhaerens TaxID=10228 RepID=B3RSL9_TRIAD|nr:hypothetical protein TRIADDRAFT_54648 [Trichoplax adhaerens]EDV26536.1 hypothetical protein TRIADDRAFT_54648 [Trichoplax adhaerens]|eukprot:XP_002110532.1 hypothetical protein TRIADDRAFT_54648 [Trichoplax adhaerens]
MENCTENSYEIAIESQDKVSIGTIILALVYRSNVAGIAASTTSLTFPIHALVLMIFKGETLRQIYKLKKIFWLRLLPLAILTNLIVAFTYYPLNFTAPTDITAIFSSVLSMVYILSVLFLKEPFVLLRALAVCLSTTGVVLFAFDDGFGSFATLGVILSVFFTLTAACFRVYEKYSIGDASPIQASMLLTIISIINFLLGWIPVVIFHYTGFEKLTWSDIPWEPLMITNLFNMLHSCFVVIGVAVTYPVFISLGSLFGIPINAVIDAIFRNESFSALKIVSTLLLAVGFLILLIPLEKAKSISRTVVKLLTCRHGKA